MLASTRYCRVLVSLIIQALCFFSLCPSFCSVCALYFKLTQSAAGERMSLATGRTARSASVLQCGNAPRNLICAFHALSLLSLIYPTSCVGVYGCEIRFPSMAGIPHCSCQREGGNVWQHLARFPKPEAPARQTERRRRKSRVAPSIRWLYVHRDIIIWSFYEGLSVTMPTRAGVVTPR